MTVKRDAARTKSGKSVDHSDPELRVGPTLPLTAGRNPEACPSCITSQRKSGRERESGALATRGGAAAHRTPTEQPPSSEPLDADSVSRLIGFFRKLDQWDRQITSQEVM